MPLVGRQIGREASVKDGNPAQWNAHGHGRAQQDVGFHFQRFEVNVRLVKPVWNSTSPSAPASFIRLPGWQSLVKNGLSFTATGILTSAFTALRMFS